MLNRTLEKCGAWGPLFIRIPLGVIFIVHGSQKLLGAFGGPGIFGFAGYLGKLRVPFPFVFSIIVTLVEFFGGIAILIGLLTRWAAPLIAIDMFMAILLVHISKGFFVSKGGWEFPFGNLFMALSLFFMGAGEKLAIDKLRKTQVEPPSG